VRRAWTAFARRHGLDAATVVAAAQGRPSHEAAHELAPDAPGEPALILQAETADTDGVVALPGAAELLAAGLPLAIVTSCARELAELRLAAAGLPEPAVLVTADDVSRGKPDPEPYLTAARLLGAAPAACVVLEDALAGVVAGRAAGMAVIAFTTGHTADELASAGADVILADPGELTIR
jgi:sugar-phosphatase